MRGVRSGIEKNWHFFFSSFVVLPRKEKLWPVFHGTNLTTINNNIKEKRYPGQFYRSLRVAAVAMESEDVAHLLRTGTCLLSQSFQIGYSRKIL